MANWQIEYYPPSNEGRSTIGVDSVEDVQTWVCEMLPHAIVELSEDKCIYLDPLSTAVAVVTAYGEPSYA